MENPFDDCFGLCPVCHNTDGYVTAGSRQYFYCEAHKKAWYAGSNLLEDWRDQSDHEQRRIWAEMDMASFEQVEPFFYSRAKNKSMTVTRMSFDNAVALDPQQRQAVLKALVQVLDDYPKSSDEFPALDARQREMVLTMLTEALWPSGSFDEAGVLDAREREVVLKALRRQRFTLVQ